MPAVMRRARWIGVALAAIGCSGAPPASGPPEIRYGYDACDRCRMSIDDPRFAAAARIGGAELGFDDIGDLTAHLDEIEKDGVPVTAWAHDFESDAWLTVADAWFVRSPEVTTPMGSGIVAFGSREAAARMAENTGGQVMSWPDLRASLGTR